MPLRSAFLASIVWITGPSCASQTVLWLPPKPAATAAELGLVTSALEDTALGPFFRPERLSEAVNVIRRIRRDYPATRDVAVIPPNASELSTYTSLLFRMADSLSKRLCDSSSASPQGYIDRWLDDPRTGIASLDNITDAMGGAKAINVQGMLPEFCLVTVYYRQSVNAPGVARAYGRLRPGIDMSPFQYLQMGDGDHVRIDASDSLWLVRFSAGWGDCMAGCVNRHVWQFRYDHWTGGIQAVADSGPPLPKRRDWQ